MNYHIVRTNETVEKIANIYNLDVAEIRELNTHIRSWNNLIPGVKIKLPEIPENVATELNDIEPFIEDYYPKISENFSSFDLQHSELIDEVKNEVKEHINEVDDNSIIQESVEIKSNNIPIKNEQKNIGKSNNAHNIGPHQYYNPAFYNPYMYYQRYYYPFQQPKRKR